MSYFADSAATYILRQTEGMLSIGAATQRRLLFALPALPSHVVLALANRLDSYCLRSGRVELVFKIALSEWQVWSIQDQTTAKDHGWTDETGNLTCYRNALPPTDGRIGLMVLVGVDRVTDASGLADFHQCGPDVIWNEQMGTSFGDWVRFALRAAGLNDEVNARLLARFDDALRPLIKQGRADLLQIADALERVDFTQAVHAEDAFAILMRSLGKLGLPVFHPPSRRKIDWGTYYERAAQFFSYSLYLDERERSKARKAIDAFREALADGTAPIDSVAAEETYHPYATWDDYLNGIQRYVEEDDQTERSRLLGCDFIFLADKVLRFRKPSEKPEKDTVRKLDGSPVEVVLHGLWATFADFAGADLAFTEVERIEIEGVEFRHDYEESDEDQGDNPVEREEQARVYLRRLTGGVDGLVERHVMLVWPGQAADRLVEISCRLCGENVSYRYAGQGEPSLTFSVSLVGAGLEGPFFRRFAWRLPDIHSYRLAEGLIRWASDALRRCPDTWKLPVFHVPYYEELIRARDDEETRRVLLHSIRDAFDPEKRITSLLTREWLESDDGLIASLKPLADSYVRFLDDARANGLHAALETSWTMLRQTFLAACEAFVAGSAQDTEMLLAPVLMRVFLVVRRRGAAEGDHWVADPEERSGVATALHPAVLEMLHAQSRFLFSCFNAATARELRRKGIRKLFSDGVWNGFIDLASIRSPLETLLCDGNQSLDTNIRGLDLIHRIGLSENENATLSTRLLLRYEGFEDEELADVELFRDTRESRLLHRLMVDYFRLHPHARDGLSLAVYRNADIQPVIAAVHQYLMTLADRRQEKLFVLHEGRRKPYAMTVTIFSESGDDVGAERWIEQWRERWEAAESESKFEPYRHCRFSVAHRIVPEQNRFASFRRLIQDSLEADIAVLYDFIGAGQVGNRFERVEPYDVRTRTLQFPILEKACCAVRNPARRFQRTRLLSNRQFRLCSLHTEVMARLKHAGVATDREHVVMSIGDYQPWMGIVDALHARAEWVVCIDPNMDERLVKERGDTSPREREIIGFGSGVGLHGESNYTVSTELFSLSDVRHRLAASIRSLYGPQGWTGDECRQVADSVLREASELSGLSLVRATGVGQYIREFMAYALTRKMLRERDAVLCDQLVSLDAYRHWFDGADDGRRPDLLWLTARLDTDGRIRLNLRLVECKLAERSIQHLLKARDQIQNGLRVLHEAFQPRCADTKLLDDVRPDQRYWWLQLHRLIASKSEIAPAQQSAVMSALERLADGDYDIAWGGAVFAFWCDDSSAVMRCAGSWTVNEGTGEVAAEVFEMGSDFVKALCTTGTAFPMPWEEITGKAQVGGGNVCDELPAPEEHLASAVWDEDDEYPPPSGDELEVGATGGEHEPLPLTPESPPATGTGAPIERVELGTPLVLPPPSPPVDAVPALTIPVPAIPQRVLLGTAGEGREIYWEFGCPGLQNRHLMIFGSSGTGKTYAIQCLLCELGRLGQNSLIVDYTDGFLPSQLAPPTISNLSPVQHYVRQAPLPVNPFKKQTSIEEGMVFEDTPAIIAKRVASIFKSVYELGDQQFSLLIDAITQGVEQDGEGFTLAGLVDILESFLDEESHSRVRVRDTLSKLKPFMQQAPFAGDGDMGWERLLTDTANRCHIFQFFKVDRHTARAMIEFVLWDLYAFARSFGTERTPRVVILDEVQNLDLGLEAPVGKYLTEGRKFGLSLIVATQTLNNLKGDRLSRLFQAAQKLFFRPSDNELSDHARLLQNAAPGTGTTQEWIARLSGLQKGECWSLGPVLNEKTGKLETRVYKVRVRSLEERGFHG